SHGTTAFISAKNFSRRVGLRNRSNSFAASVSCLFNAQPRNAIVCATVYRSLRVSATVLRSFLSRSLVRSIEQSTPVSVALNRPAHSSRFTPVRETNGCGSFHSAIESDKHQDRRCIGK